MLLNKKGLKTKTIMTACGKKMDVIENIFRLPGLYVCHNIETNFIYIGKALDIEKRIKEHKAQLQKNEKKKRNGELSHWQKSFNKRG